MHVYQDHPVGADGVSAYLNTHNDTQFAVIHLGAHIRIHVKTPAEAEALIVAAVKVKQLLAPPAPVITASEATAPGCGARHPIGAACELHRGGFHVAPGEEGDLDMEWRIDPEQLVAS